MKDQSYDQFVQSRLKPVKDIFDQLTEEKADLIHAAMLIAGEAGELLDAVKKHVVYNKPLDRENCVEEMGDLEFGMSYMRKLLGVSREQIQLLNQEKLTKRYEKGYSDKAAAERADKARIDEVNGGLAIEAAKAHAASSSS
jgi:NTP pyrophosphatase (non-canonical NTP hydrolase)